MQNRLFLKYNNFAMSQTFLCTVELMAIILEKMTKSHENPLRGMHVG